MLFLRCIRFALVALAALVSVRGKATDIVFNRDVRPILSEHCFECHGPDQATREAELRLDVAESASSVIEPGDAEASELIRRIHSTEAGEQMPPQDSKKQLTKKQRDLLTQWVRQGGHFQGHWAFIPPQPTQPPLLEHDDWSKNPIDHFVRQRLQQAGLQPSPRATRETLARRITLDLTGAAADAKRD